MNKIVIKRVQGSVVTQTMLGYYPLVENFLLCETVSFFGPQRHSIHSL